MFVKWHHGKKPWKVSKSWPWKNTIICQVYLFHITSFHITAFHITSFHHSTLLHSTYFQIMHITSFHISQIPHYLTSNYLIPYYLIPHSPHQSIQSLHHITPHMNTLYILTFISFQLICSTCTWLWFIYNIYPFLGLLWCFPEIC